MAVSGNILNLRAQALLRQAKRSGDTVQFLETMLDTQHAALDSDKGAITTFSYGQVTWSRNDEGLTANDMIAIIQKALNMHEKGAGGFVQVVPQFRNNH